MSGFSPQVSAAVAVLSLGLPILAASGAGKKDDPRARWSAIEELQLTFNVENDHTLVSGGSANVRRTAHREAHGSCVLRRSKDQSSLGPRWHGTGSGSADIDVEVRFPKSPSLDSAEKGGGQIKTTCDFATDFTESGPGTYSLGVSLSGGTCQDSGPTASSTTHSCSLAELGFEARTTLPGGTTLSGSGMPANAVKNAHYTFTLAPAGSRPPSTPVVEGRQCLCDGDAGAIHARIEGKPDGTFLPFEVGGGGHATDNHGGTEATVMVQGDPTIDPPATVVGVFRKADGLLLKSAPFTVHFCKVQKPEAQPNGFGGTKHKSDDPDYHFDENSPAHVEVDFNGKAWLDGKDASSQLHWVESSGLLSAKNAVGERVTLTADGLPERNSQFGPRQVEGQFTDQGCSCQSEKAGLRLFYPLQARNGPRPDVPNWFYYYGQTRPAQPFTFKYSETPPTKCGVEPPEGSVVVARHCNGVIYLMPTLMPNHCYPHPDGTRNAYIDCFAATLLHENQHAIDEEEWWPGGYDIADDLDGDFVPDTWEKSTHGQYGCRPFASHSCNTLPNDKAVTDIDVRALPAGWAWPVGSDDGEDWAYPGKQWPQ